MNTTKRYLFYIAQNYSFAILRPLQEEIKKQGHTVKWFFSGTTANKDYLKADEEVILTLRELYKYQPQAVFAPGNIIPSFIPGIKVALFHGFNVGKRADHKGHFKIRGCFDLYCTQGPNTTQKFMELSQKYQYFKTVETGWTMLDPLFKNPINKSSSQKTILLCSTFTPKLSCAPKLIETIKSLRDKKDWHWLVQFHPKMPIEVVETYKALQNEKLTFIETDDVLPLLAKADVMLCDTSSILLMFLLQNRPVVTYKNNRPGEHLINVESSSYIEEAIEHALTYPQDLMAKIANFKNELHPSTDAQSSRRVLIATNNLIDNPMQLVKRKPLNFIKNIKQLYKLLKQF